MSSHKQKKHTLLTQIDCAEDRGHFVFAASLYKSFILLGGANTSAYLLYADCLSQLGLYAQAFDAIATAEKIASEIDRPQIHRCRGDLLFHTGDLRQSEAEYLCAHRKEPNEASFLIKLGRVNVSLQQLEASEMYFWRGSQCSSGPVEEALFNLAASMATRNRIEEACEYCLQALAIDPDYELAKKLWDDLQNLAQRE